MKPILGPPFEHLSPWRRLVLAVAMVLLWAQQPTTEGPKQGLIFELLLLAAVFVASDLLKGKTKTEDERPDTNIRFPTASEGRVVPLCWGRVLVEGPNVIWYDDVRTDAVVESVKTGLFSSTNRVTGYRYHVGIQMELCRGPIDGVRRVWVGEKLAYDGGLATSTLDIDEPNLFGGEDTGNVGGVQATLDVALGTTTQAVNAYLALFQDSGAGTDRTPRYTGSAYVVIRELGAAAATSRGGYVGNSPSIQPFKFEIERYPPVFSGQTAGQNKIGVDCNPMNVVYEILTNTEWGFGRPSGDIDIGPGSTFAAASTTLIAEANGFSLLLDTATEAADFLQELMRQIDGVIYLDHRTGRWKVKLARADYDINTVPQLDESNLSEIQDFTRGSWEDTSNQVTIKFSHRGNDYKESFALAQDGANAMIRGDGTVSTIRVVAEQLNYPGVKDPALANQLAWRDLRAKSYPLARAGLVCNRMLWDISIGSVVAWSDARLGFTKLPMRVTEINYGTLEENQMTLTAVQDVFAFAQGAFAPPPVTQWEPPTADLVAFPTAQQLAVSAPRGIVVRDPLFNGNDQPTRLLVAARRQGNESGFEIRSRYYVGAPAGTFEESGHVVSFMRIGKLVGTLPMAESNPRSTITIEPSPDLQAALEPLFSGATTLEDMGQSLAQLIMIGDGDSAEFMLVQNAANNGANVDLQTVYRGVMDTPQVSHADDEPVYVLFVGAGIADRTFTNTGIGIQVELRMQGLGGTYEGAVTTITVPVDSAGRRDYRTVRPYPPAAIRYNSSGTPFTTPSLEGAGSGLNGFRIDVDWWRRDFRAADELTALLSDSAAVLSGTEYQLEVRADPLGANTLVGSVSSWTAGTGTLQVLRTAIITAAAAGTLLRFILRARHDYLVADQEGWRALQHDVTPTSSLTGQFYLGGGVNDNTSTASYTAAATGTFTANIGAADAANIEVNVAGGGFVTVIAAGNTTGTFSATTSDSIVFRRLTGGSPDPQFIELQNPSAVAVAYGTFD